MTVMCATHHIPINRCGCSADEQYRKAQLAGISRDIADMSTHLKAKLALINLIVQHKTARIKTDRETPRGSLFSPNNELINSSYDEATDTITLEFD